MKRLINLLLCIFILFELTSCKSKDNESVSQVGLNESFDNTNETIDYTYKKSDLQTDKTETVYVDLDPYGNTKSIEVNTTLRSKEEGDIKDVATLKNVINTSGDEEYTIKDDVIYFENHGEDITYKGNIDKDLPISIKITYYLDDLEVKAEELAHKSGHVKIKFEYINNTSSNYSNIKVPFACISLIMLDDEKFSNISLENGKLLTVSDNKIVVLYGEPGLKDSLELYKINTFDDIKFTDTAYFEADVNDFTLDYTATLVSNGLFDEIKDEDINDLSSSINDLSELNNKIDDIKDATNTLIDESKELVDGIGEIKDGVVSLSEGVNKYNEAIKNISTLTEGMASLANGILQLANSENVAYESLKQLAIGLQSLVNAYETYGDTLNNISLLISNINYGEDANLDDESIEAIETLKSIDFSVLSSNSENFINLKNGINELVDNLNSETNQNNINTIVYNANLLNNSASALNSDDSKNALIEGMNNIASGTSSLKDVMIELNDNMPKLTDGVNEFSDKLNEAIEKSRDDLNKFSGSNMKNIINNLRNIKVVDKEYDTYIGKLDDMTSSVSFIYETSEIK